MQLKGGKEDACRRRCKKKMQRTEEDVSRKIKRRYDARRRGWDRVELEASRRRRCR